MDYEQRVRERAHKIWEQEGRPNGREREHWERALQDLEKATQPPPTGMNEVPEANVVIHRGGEPPAPLPGFEPADGLHTPGVPAETRLKPRDKP